MKLKKESNSEEFSAKITVSTEYEFKDYKTKKEYGEFYKNGSYTTVITQTKNGDYYIDGQKLDEEILNQSIEISQANNNLVQLAESGGKSFLTYYTNYGSGLDFYFKTYSDADTFMQYGKGNYLAKWGDGGTTRASDFKMYANNVAIAQDNVSIDCYYLTIGLAVVLLTWELVLWAILYGTSLALTALHLYVNSVSDRKAMENAYVVGGFLNLSRLKSRDSWEESILVSVYLYSQRFLLFTKLSP